MRETGSECVSCGLPCLGRACPNYEVTRFYCDKCKQEATLYEYEGEEWCADCILEDLPVVEGSEEY